MSREASLSFDDPKRLALLATGVGYFAVIDSATRTWQGYLILPKSLEDAAEHIERFRGFFRSQEGKIETYESSKMSTMMGESFEGLRDEDRGLFGNFCSSLVIGHREQKHGMLSACAAMIVHLTGHRFFVITSRSLHGSDMMESGYDYTDNSIVAMAAAASGTSEADAMSRMIAARPDVVAMDERPAVRHLTHGPGKRKKKRK